MLPNFVGLIQQDNANRTVGYQNLSYLHVFLTFFYINIHICPFLKRVILNTHTAETRDNLIQSMT